MPTPGAKPRPGVTHLAPAAPPARTAAPRPPPALAATAKPFSPAGSLCLEPAGDASRRVALRLRRPLPCRDDRTARGRVVWKRSHERRFHMAIATQEQTVVDKVAKQLYIGGEW